MSEDARRRFRLVESIFREAIAAPPRDRSAVVAARTDDPAVRAEVEALLAEDAAGSRADDPLAAVLDAAVADAAGVVLGSGAAAGPGGAVPGPPGGLGDARAETPPAPPPARIGRYRILRELGRGGMGVVHEAEQDETKRRVALKLVATGVASPALADRLRREARALGRLAHPGIARVLEAGTVDAGSGPVPFFAMELVDGRPITEALGDAPIDRRLDVLAEVADAVHHAHQRGVVHRDLKPANVLVDEAGRPRVVDFGVARLLEPDEDLGGPVTVSGQLIGTPAYMSPEQAAGDPAAIDARTDIHALGVLAHEVLSGRPPLDLSGRSFDEQLRRVREAVPRPLTRADGVPRDVAAVVARAMEKDPARRHASAAALADDLRAARDGRPVSARRPTLAYQASRFVARHPLGTGLAAGLALVLAGGAIAIAVLLGRSLDAEAAARAQLARAEREAAISDGVRSFLVEDVMLAVHPERAGSETMSTDELVAAAAATVLDRFGEKPEVGREVLRTLIEIDLALGRHARAAEHLALADRLPPAEATDDDPAAIARAESFALARAGVRSTSGDHEAAIELYRRLVDARRARLGPEHPDTLVARYELGRAECNAGNLDAGLSRLEAVLDARTRAGGPDAPEALAVRVQIGFTLLDHGRFAEAAEVLEPAARATERALGPDDWDTINAWINLGDVRRSLGDLEGALAAFDRARAGFDARGTSDDTYRRIALDMNVGLTRMELGDLDGADELLRRALANAAANGEEDTAGHQAMRHNFGALQMLRGNLAEAEAILADVRAVRTRLLGADDLETLLTTGLLGEVRRRAGRHAAAIEAMETAYAGFASTVGPDHPYALATARRIAASHDARGDEAARATWTKRAEPPTPPPAEPPAESTAEPPAPAPAAAGGAGADAPDG